MALGNVPRRKQEGHTAIELIRKQPPTLHKPEKGKSIKINIRIREDLWTAFLEVCAQSGTNASEELRSYIQNRLI